jgi:excisionase family DNA binding protein
MSTLVVSLDDAALDELADRLAARLSKRLSGEDTDGGYLTPEGAARYLGVGRRRIYDLKSGGRIEPDGFDGRTPLFTRQTLDGYVQHG